MPTFEYRGMQQAEDKAGETGPDPGCDDMAECVIDGVARGVAGADGDGDAASTTHMR